VTGYLDTAVERVPLGNHAGKSGAALERVLLADGRRLVVKRLSPATDLLMALSGDSTGREYDVWASGLLDRLPAGVGHAVLDGWREADGAVLVMRDLGDTVIDATREEVIAEYRALAGPADDEAALRLALLGGLVWLGWNKALDVAEHPDPVIRERERADLSWWVGQARRTLDAGLL
jgi:hypothetical protein